MHDRDFGVMDNRYAGSKWTCVKETLGCLSLNRVISVVLETYDGTFPAPVDRPTAPWLTQDA